MGPKFYSEEYDADALKHMVGKHIGKKLEEVQRKRWVELLLESANEIGLPDDPEFRSTFVAHLEWGSRVAVINSQLDENPTTSQDQIPEWGWEKSKVSLKQLVHCSKEREMNNIQTICCF